MFGIRMFVEEGLGHSSYVIDLGDGTAAVVDPPRFPTEHLAAIRSTDATLVDVRQRSEYTAGHVPKAVNVELGSLAGADIPRGPVTVMCGHGERAMTAASILAAHGRSAVTVLNGGPDTWATATGRALEVPR